MRIAVYARVSTQRQTQMQTIEQQYATKKDFREMVNYFHPHIIHFIGHGQRVIGSGKIVFVKNKTQPDPLEDKDFALRVSANKDIKLVFLQICEETLSDPYNSVLGIALQLAHKNIPAVVAMQQQVESRVANTFACSFYKAPAKGLPVDLAVKAGREAIMDEDPKELQYHSFGLPVLYLRSYESLIVQEQPAKSRLGNALPDEYKCPRCGIFQQQGNSFCIKCGLCLDDLRYTCLFCEHRLEQVFAKYCNECGKPSLCANCKKMQLDSKDHLNCKFCRDLIGDRSIQSINPVQKPQILISNAPLPGVTEEEYADPTH